MKYLSAQPDEPYFLWQLKVQIANFNALGIEDDLIILVGTTGQPSVEAKHIKANTTAQVHFIPDTRTDKSYAPSIQFALYAKFFESNKIGCPYMLIDSDVIFFSPLDVDHLLADDVIYMSDTRSYLGYEYLTSKGEEQLQMMATMVGIRSADVWINDDGAGGAQTIMKGFEEPAFWKKVEADSLMLYKFMTLREPLWKGPGYPIQRWTAGMWAFLWNLWRASAETRIVPELDFYWGSDDISAKRKTPKILHLAGVTAEMRDTHFYKGDFITNDPLLLPTDRLQLMSNTPSNMSHAYVFAILAAKDRWQV